MHILGSSLEELEARLEVTARSAEKMAALGQYPSSMLADI